MQQLIGGVTPPLLIAMESVLRRSKRTGLCWKGVPTLTEL